MAGEALDIPGLAELVWSTVLEHYQAAGVKLPGRQVMAPGAPEAIAYDCEQLVMTMSGIGIGSAPGVGTGPRQAGPGLSAMSMRHVVFTFDLVRCDPAPTNGGRTPPAARLMTEAALALWRDAGLLSHALIRVGTDLTKTNALPLGTLVEAGAVLPTGPEGGFVGLRGSIAVTAGKLA